MEAKELRIGNYVNLIADGHEKEPDTFKWDLEDYEFYYDKMDFVKPIPITEEIYYKLEKYLLELYFSYSHNSEHNSINIFINNFDLNFVFLHQLQNLYFCLTNKELELCDI